MGLVTLVIIEVLLDLEHVGLGGHIEGRSFPIAHSAKYEIVGGRDGPHLI